MTGKTVEEAVDQACAALGLSRDEVGYEVIDMPQRKLFGSVPAKVRVYVTEDAFSVKDLLQSQDAGEEPTGPVNPEAEKKRDRKEKKPEKQAEKIEAQKPERQPQSALEDAKPQQTAVESAPEIAPEPVGKEIPESELSGPSRAALQYLKDIAAQMQATNLTYKVVEHENGVKFVVDGEDAAILIGRRGEVMDALQYLCLLVSNRSEGEYCKISLDIANYRAKREKTLEALAKRMAGKVLKNRRSQTLEPMNPYERRIVHSAIQGIDGVKSESVGEEPHRRVVVLLEGDTVRPNQGRRDNNRGGNRGGGQGQRRDGGQRRDPSGRGGHDNRDRGYNRDNRDRKPRNDDYEAPKLSDTPPEPKPQDPELEKNLYGKIEF